MVGVVCAETEMQEGVGPESGGQFVSEQSGGVRTNRLRAVQLYTSGVLLFVVVGVTPRVVAQELSCTVG